MAFLVVFLLFLLPNQSYMSYRRYNIDTLCRTERINSFADGVHYSKDRATTIYLHDSPSMSSVLIEHVWDNGDNSSHTNVNHCEFNMETRSKYLHGASSGLFAAIRELNFRQNGEGECSDYIILEVNTLTAPTSHKICGNVDSDGMPDEKNYFELPEGSLKVTIHVNPHKLETKPIIMKLTFTAFDDCTGSYKLRCTDSRCISQSLFNDLIVNCIPPHCVDEPNSKCGTKSTSQLPSTQTSILIVCLVFVVMFIAVAIAWYVLKLYVKYNPFYFIGTTDDAVAYAQSDSDTIYGEARHGKNNPPSYASFCES